MTGCPAARRACAPLRIDCDCDDDQDFVGFDIARINDWNRSCDIASARPWLGRLREWYPEAPVFVFEPIWAGKEGMDVSPKPNSAGRTLADARRELGGIVDEFPGIVRVGSDRLMPAVAAFLSDGLHPNDAGHAVYGLNAANAIREALRRRA